MKMEGEKSENFILSRREGRRKKKGRGALQWELPLAKAETGLLPPLHRPGWAGGQRGSRARDGSAHRLFGGGTEGWEDNQS